MQYFFIGGPWNNRLREFYLPVGRCLRVPLPAPSSMVAGPNYELITPKWVEYRHDEPLPTGCPVMSCLPIATWSPRLVPFRGLVLGGREP